jgi:rhamnose utilization protein RhaD (predicted bifunctional aldolase and dehydrogenase)
MDPFDTIDITEDGEFIFFKNGLLVTYEEAEACYEAGICFTRKAENELMAESSEFLKDEE